MNSFSIDRLSRPTPADPRRALRIIAMFLRFLVLAVATTFSSMTAVAAETSHPVAIRPAFVGGLGLGSSGEYADQLEATYGNVTGFTGWVIMDAGFEIPVAARVSVVPDLRWMFSRISYEGPFGTLDKFNSLFSGRAGARFRPTGRTNGPYLHGSIGAFVASSGLSELDFSAKNPSLGVGVGVTFGDYELELLYDWLQVETRYSGQESFPPAGIDGSAENFGGIGFLVKRRVSL